MFYDFFCLNINALCQFNYESKVFVHGRLNRKKTCISLQSSRDFHTFPRYISSIYVLNLFCETCFFTKSNTQMKKVNLVLQIYVYILTNTHVQEVARK